MTYVPNNEKISKPCLQTFAHPSGYSLQTSVVFMSLGLPGGLSSDWCAI